MLVAAAAVALLAIAYCLLRCLVRNVRHYLDASGSSISASELSEMAATTDARLAMGLRVKHGLRSPVLRNKGAY